MYEGKKYTKGLKLSQKILKKNPKHPETKSMHALFKYFTTDEKEKYEKEAKTALALNFKSAFCWNIYGMICKLNKKVKLAALNFTQALKYDPENVQILREVTNLHLLSRNYEKHLETRRKILFNKPTIMYNWCGFICANHLVGDYEQALEALDSLIQMDTKKEQQASKDDKKKGIFNPQDKNAVYIYRLLLFSEMGKWQELLDYADKNEDCYIDKLKMREFRVKALIQLERWQEAAQNLETLLTYIPENEKWITLYQDCLEKTGVSRSETLQKLKEKNERSKIIPKLELRELEGDSDEFKERIEKGYVKAAKKVSPTYFRELRPFYSDPKKLEVIEEVILTNLKTLEEGSTFRSLPEEIQFPTTLMYAYYLAAWHFYLKKEYPTSLEYAEKCEKHTPTFLENAILKAKIHKRLLQFDKASDALLLTFKQDEADRYMVNKTSKYMFLANRIVGGDNIFKSVIMDKITTDKTIHSLQKIWYEITLGSAYIRQRKWGRGLRMFQFMHENLEEIFHDQNDFFNFPLRKFNMIEFMDMVRFNVDKMYDSKRFIRGYALYLRFALVYLRNKELEEAQLAEKTKGMKSSDRKKVVKAAAKKRAEGSIETTKEQAKELDYYGEKLLQDGIPVDVIAKKVALARPKKLKDRRLVYTSLFDYYYHEGTKPLLTLRAFHSLSQAYEEDDVELLFRRVLFLKQVSEAKENAKLNKKVKTYLIKLTEGYKDLSAEAELKKLDDKAQESVLAKIYAIIVRYHLKEHTVVENAQKLTELLDKDLFDNLPNSSKQEIFDAITTLNFYGVDSIKLNELCLKCEVDLGLGNC